MLQNVESLRFKIHSGGWASLPAGTTFGPRDLNDFEFLWIIEGDCWGQLDDVKFDLHPGSVVLAHDGMTDYYEWDKNKTTLALYIHFRIDRGLDELRAEKTWPLVRQMPEDDIIRPMLRHLMWLMDQNQPDHRVMAHGILRQLMMAYLSGGYHTSAQTAVQLPEPVQRAFRFIQETLSDSEVTEIPNLSDMADAAGVSVGHLCRVFRASIGCGPMQALRLMRVDHASKMLAESNMKVQDVSAAMGFESAFHFSRCFREAFGVSPREFRKKAALRQVYPQSRLRVIRSLVGPF